MTKGKNDGAKNQRTREEAPQGPPNACERTLKYILQGLVFLRVLFPRIQEFTHGKFEAFG